MEEHLLPREQGESKKLKGIRDYRGIRVIVVHLWYNSMKIVILNIMKLLTYNLKHIFRKEMVLSKDE